METRRRARSFFIGKKSTKIIGAVVGLILLLIVGRAVLNTVPFYPFLFQFLFNKNIDLKKEDNQVNILLLGIGGGSHDGPNLTDTIIFANFNLKNNKITLVSIPRDLWIPDLKNRINTSYSIGELKKRGAGLVLTEAVVSKILGENINYGVRIDFNGFIKAVDLVGGLDINVDKTFDDYEYPIEGKENDLCGHSQDELPALSTVSSQLEAFPCRYMHLHFDKGLQHMDGKTALEYVRSRHAEGSEGSDFARSSRQEKVINAFKDKIFSLQFLINPTKLLNLYSVVKESIDTDIKETEFDDFARLLLKMKSAKIQNAVVDAGDESTGRKGLLINPDISEEYNYEWVLIPKEGKNDFSNLQRYVDCEIKVGNCRQQ